MQRTNVVELHLFQGHSASQKHFVFNRENGFIFLFLDENISSVAFLKNHSKKFLTSYQHIQCDPVHKIVGLARLIEISVNRSI